jgi:predicted transcriptional regulator
MVAPMEYSMAMSTTSLKLPQEVKQLAQAAAKHQGISTHSFMVEAIRTAATAAEQRAAFVAAALEAEAEFAGTGKGYAAQEVHAWLKARAKGKPVAKPKARVWRK